MTLNKIFNYLRHHISQPRFKNINFFNFIFVLLFFTISPLTNAQQLKISGASTLKKYIESAAQTYQQNESITYSFRPVGSVLGQRQLSTGDVEIAFSEIPITNDFKDRGWIEIKFAKIPLVVITHPDVNVEDISLDQIRDIFLGKIKDWQQLNGKPGKISLITRTGLSGNMQTVCTILDIDIKDVKSNQTVKSESDLISTILIEPGSIAIVGGVPSEEKLNVLSLNEIVPSDDKAYPLYSFGRLFYNPSTLSANGAGFITFFIQDETIKQLSEISSELIHFEVEEISAKDLAFLNTLKEEVKENIIEGWLIIGTILAGIALFLVGIKFITSGLKSMTSNRLRKLFEQQSNNYFFGAILGLLSGAISQSSSSSAFILVSMVSSGVLKIKNAFYILSWAEVGTTLLVFVATWNMHIAVLYFLSISGLLFALDKRKNNQQFYQTMLGFGLLLFGYDLIKSTSSDFTEMLWVKQMIELGIEYPWILFITGALLRLITQSSSTVAILAISISHGGTIDQTQIILMLIGTAAGSGLSSLLLSSSLEGTPKQIGIVKSIADITSAIILISMLLISSEFIDNLSSFLGSSLEKQAAWFFLIVKITPGILMIALAGVFQKAAAKLAPASNIENLSRLQYFQDNLYENTEIALLSARRESFRIIERLPSYLESIREEEEYYDNELKGNYLEFHEAAVEINKRLHEIHSEIMQMDITTEKAEMLIKMYNCHVTQTQLENKVYEFVVLLEKLELQELSTLKHIIIEAAYTNLVLAADQAKEFDEIQHSFLLQTTSDKSDALAEIRGTYMNENSTISGETRSLVIQLTNCYQKMIWLLNDWCKQMEEFETLDDQ